MAWIIALLIALWPSEAEALRAQYPADLTTETAAANLVAARLAAAAERVDAHMLLYIAWHESRFRSNQVTLEPGRKVSCGVMTPVPRRACRDRALLDQYLEGAAHLRGWYAACAGDARCALLGYAGGYALIRACGRRGRMWRRRGVRRVDLCATADLYESGAAQVADALRR